MAKVGSSLIQGDGALPISGYGGTIVSQSQKGQLLEIVEGGCHVGLGEDPSLLQVAVCEISQRVVKGYYAFLNIWGEGGMPERGRVSCSKEDAPPPPCPAWQHSLSQSPMGSPVPLPPSALVIVRCPRPRLQSWRGDCGGSG